MATRIPTSRKVNLGAVGGAIAGLLIWAAEEFTTVVIPAYAAANITTLCMWTVGWVVQEEAPNNAPPTGTHSNLNISP